VKTCNELVALFSRPIPASVFTLWIDCHKDPGRWPDEADHVVTHIVAKSGTSFVPDKKIEVTGNGLHVYRFDERGRHRLPVKLGQDARHQKHLRVAL
jgi:hypothetical protein